MARVFQPEVAAMTRIRTPYVAPSTPAPSATNPATSGTAAVAPTQTSAVDVATLRQRQDYFHESTGALGCRIGQQDDGKVGIRIWNALGVMQFDQTYS